MITPRLWGLDLPPNDIGSWVIRVLAIAGGGAIGGLLVGWITQVLARLLTTKPVPRGPLNIVRLLGAIIAGWLVALLMVPGLGGLGGGGGKGNSEGSGKEGGQERPGATAPEADTARTGTAHDTSKTTPTNGWTMHITVMPTDPVVYEVTTPAGTKKYPYAELAELEKYMLDQTTADSPLIHVKIDAQSSENATGVRELREWVKSHHLN